jgi:hypothetical protein
VSKPSEDGQESRRQLLRKRTAKLGKVTHVHIAQHSLCKLYAPVIGLKTNNAYPPFALSMKRFSSLVSANGERGGWRQEKRQFTPTHGTPRSVRGYPSCGIALPHTRVDSCGERVACRRSNCSLCAPHASLEMSFGHGSPPASLGMIRTQGYLIVAGSK